MYKRVWRVIVIINGFKTLVFVETTEEKLTEYLRTELPNYAGYSGATDKEVELAKGLGLSIYMY